MHSPDSGVPVPAGAEPGAYESGRGSAVSAEAMPGEPPTGSGFRRWFGWRAGAGCLLTFACVVLFYLAIGGVAVRHVNRAAEEDGERVDLAVGVGVRYFVPHDLGRGSHAISDGD